MALFPLPALLFIVLVAEGLCPPVAAQNPPLPAAEFRAAWVATVVNIDWPSRPSLPAATAKAELLAIVERAAQLRLNALIFQCRSAGDAFYQSSLEPWSEWLSGVQGKPPDGAWDPLQFLVEKAHARGIEVHAWFNPFRARSESARSPEAENHVLVVQPSACVRYGEQMWMDPGDSRSIDWILRVVADVVRRYDIDGVHFDDYFYPYPAKKLAFADDRSFRRYQDASGGLGRSDWRRANIDIFLRRLYADIHQLKPAIKLGISPFGIARPSVPRGIQAGIDQYEELAADVLSWQRKGLCDYLSPQLYWPIDQRAQSYSILLPWWFGQNPRQRHMWPGLNASRAEKQIAPWRKDELPQQIKMIRSQGPDPGYVLYSFQALRGQLGEQIVSMNREPAVVPASPWLPGRAPDAPVINLERTKRGTTLSWLAKPDCRWFCVQVQRGRRWQTLAMRGAGAGAIMLPDDVTAAAVRGLAANGLVGNAAVLYPNL
ncbi:MAG: family 10 glycosylhydrolase [Planctomycetota bacterium]|nr:family 10 glycosylhydrolase [Planctomycetota bacterium]